MQSEKCNCRKCGREFLVIVEEQRFYKKKGLPLPENCPECRQKRRLSLRNERVLHKRKCNKCGKGIVSSYRENSPYQIYCTECFWDYLG